MLARSMGYCKGIHLFRHLRAVPPVVSMPPLSGFALKYVSKVSFWAPNGADRYNSKSCFWPAVALQMPMHHRFMAPKRFPQRGVSSLKILAYLLLVPAALALAGSLAFGLALILANDRVPSLEALTDYRPKIPMRVFSADGTVIGEFGEERRSLVRIDEVPDLMIKAILAAEDDRFFDHIGIDFQGVIRAAVKNIRDGRREGASTITQQLARNFFLSPEKSYTRKIFEILIALRIEQSLTKEQILEIYLNQIYLGQRAYGFAAAAQAYYGKTLAQLTPAEAAMLAGLPKAPSLYNPVVNPKRATIRQQYVLNRMRTLGFLTEQEHLAAIKEEPPLRQEQTGKYALHAPYVAELARQLAHEMFQDEAYTAGLQVHTTILDLDQGTATAAVRQGVFDYDHKYGYRGPEAYIDVPPDGPKADEAIEQALNDYPDVDEELVSAIVLEASPKRVVVSLGKNAMIGIQESGLKFAAPALSDKVPSAKRIRRGAVVRVAPSKSGNGYEITQTPEVESAFVSADTVDGAIRALVGGFEFNRTKFNRVTQALRQPGSAFKPFIYSAALEKGFMTSTVINDAPVIVDPALTGGQLWEPKNYDGQFDGPMTMRTALTKSKNMVSIRLLQAIGAQYAQDYISRFGFESEKNPPVLTLALGAGAVTPWQMVGAYSVFANGGYRIEPYIIAKITDSQGRVLAQAHPGRAGDEALRIIDARNAFLMDSIMRDVIRVGTATSALKLKRRDLAGKTGTTNDAHDAWFAGYQPRVAAVAWVGYDQPHKLGDKETGGGLALPIWISYMGRIMRGVPEINSEAPAGIAQIGGEYYYNENKPGTGIAALGISEDGVAGYGKSPERTEQIRDQIF
jgi:penicillin-binding protein 1A